MSDEFEDHDDEHARNIGWIVLALTNHEVGDFRDCGINDPIVNIIDTLRPSHELLVALSSMSHERAAGIVAQL